MDKTTLFYTEDHEWIQLVDEHTARIGISDHAVEQLGDIVYVELPDVDDELDAEGEAGNIESVKSTSEIFTPVAGTVTAVNEDLEDEPEKVNEDPYALGWIFEIKSDDAIDTSAFLTYEQYQEHIG